jgi:hypothetical protein
MSRNYTNPDMERDEHVPLQHPKDDVMVERYEILGADN